MEDCKKCGQTIENCECHIPDEVKHAGLYKMCEVLTRNSNESLDYEPAESMETLNRRIEELEINQFDILEFRRVFDFIESECVATNLDDEELRMAWEQYNELKYKDSKYTRD